MSNPAEKEPIEVPDAPLTEHQIMMRQAWGIQSYLNQAQQSVTAAADLIQDFYVNVQTALCPPSPENIPMPSTLHSRPEPAPPRKRDPETTSLSDTRQKSKKRPQPDTTLSEDDWTPDQLDELVSMKLDEKSRPSWSVVASRVGRSIGACQEKWNEIKPPRTNKLSG